MSDIEKMKSMFRILTDWNITYGSQGDTDYRGQMYIKSIPKSAHIFPPSDDVDVDEYLIHEMLHCAIRATDFGDREQEEIFVQDLCEILKQGECGND